MKLSRRTVAAIDGPGSDPFAPFTALQPPSSIRAHPPPPRERRRTSSALRTKGATTFSKIFLPSPVAKPNGKRYCTVLYCPVFGGRSDNRRRVVMPWHDLACHGKAWHFAAIPSFPTAPIYRSFYVHSLRAVRIVWGCVICSFHAYVQRYSSTSECRIGRMSRTFPGGR